MSSGITRVAGPEDLADRSSTARAALAAGSPVPQGEPDGVGDVGIASETPMQDLSKRVANGVHVASACLEHKRLRGRKTATRMADVVIQLEKERRVNLQQFNTQVKASMRFVK